MSREEARMKDKLRGIIQEYAEYYLRMSDKFADRNADEFIREKLLKQQEGKLDHAHKDILALLPSEEEIIKTINKFGEYSCNSGEYLGSYKLKYDLEAGKLFGPQDIAKSIHDLMVKSVKGE